MYSELISYRNVPVIAVKEKVSRLIEFKLASGKRRVRRRGEALIYFNISDNAGEQQISYVRMKKKKERKRKKKAKSAVDMRRVSKFKNVGETLEMHFFDISSLIFI